MSVDYLPTVLSSLPQAGGVRFELALPAEMPFLEGHFPGNPIIPGFLLLHWCRQFLITAYGFTPSLAPLTFRAVKFLRPLRPGALVALTFEQKTNTVLFTLHDKSGALCASGRVHV
jgi:3-hydroxymyristoyl/3-hydroxydecanoyl-(acyl carrier protein) dehydratase